ncbi:hypothetical protein NEAUS03_1126 [Nematocida ausubeli]|nr:hypothetical protein NEAUS03_1126 [Nematocida ausubeli]
MLIMGDINRVKIYTLSELERKEKLELVLANEFDIFAMTGLDAKDKPFYKSCIKEVMKKNPSAYNHKCNCPIQKFKQVRYIAAKDVIAYRSGKCNLDSAQIGYIMPRNSAFGRDFRDLLLLARQIVISRKESISMPFEFFTTWIGLNIGIVILLYIERYLI